MKNKAVFLDRDGIINEVILEHGKPFSPRKFEDFKFTRGIIDILKRFKEEGFLLIVITNQPDIKRGLVKEEVLKKIHKSIEENLPVDDIFVCLHDDSDNCHCRKPKPGMLLDAAKEWDIDLKKSFFIGDQWKDMDAGKKAGCVTILLDYPYNKEAKSDFRASDLKSAFNLILNFGKERNGCLCK